LIPARLGGDFLRMTAGLRQISFDPTFAGWQTAARSALAQELPPEHIAWQERDEPQPALGLFPEAPSAENAAPAFRVPRRFLSLARRVACHRDPRRWALLYRVLWRLTHGERELLEIIVDPDMHELLRMEKAIHHDSHRMHAFVRFRRVPLEGSTEWFVAWFEPEHHIVELNAPFFIERFAGMHWSILTPDCCAHWDGERISYTDGVARSAAPGEDDLEPLWLRYYAHTFNPGRTRPRLLQQHMPKRYWKNLPEAAAIPSLVRHAPTRVETMLAESEAKRTDHLGYHAAPVPPTRDLGVLREKACACTACPLFKNATQTVFGEGPLDAEIVFVGEQPGDQEDRAGRPFVGPAGLLLDRAMTEAGIDRGQCYVTNAVKHFKWEPRGKRRLHQTPNSRDIAACRPWLAAELAVLQPRVLVALGGTAARSVFERDVRVLSERGKIIPSPFAEKTIITLHPSSLLRMHDEAARSEAYTRFVADLRLAAETLRAA
jgi:uracil-DNA glycosylase